jgi:hypothetical protein
MNARHLLGIALLSAASVAACSSGDPSSLGGDEMMNRRQNSPTGQNGDPTADPSNPGSTPGTPGDSTPTPTNSPGGKSYFIANVFPALQQGCASCHGGSAAGGAPNWMVSNDAEKSYALLFSMGYVSLDSRLLAKGPHGGITTNVLSADAKTKFTNWVSMELKDGGTKAPPNVLEKIAGCMDKTKFTAIGLQNLRTIQRTNNNNTNQVQGWAENANRCTGCNQAVCRDCHTSDEGSAFVMAIGYPGQINGMSGEDFTFSETKKTNPAYLQHYFGVDATGNPVASNAIKAKADATAKGTAYTHPYFKLTQTQLDGLDAFVNDAITKYKAGQCQ